MLRRTMFLVTGLLVLASLTGVNAEAQAQMNIAYIRPSYIFDNYAPYQQALTQLQDYELQERQQLQADSDKFQQQYEEFDRQQLLMSDEIKAQRMEELQRQRDALDLAYNDLYSEGGLLDQKQAELIEPIITDMNEILVSVGDSGSYDFIFDADQGLLYANEQYDISDMVLEELNKGVAGQ